jgi:ribose transport system ATP-binding protein
VVTEVAEDAGTPLLRVRDLTKSFGGPNVLSRVDLDILPGEVHALIGQNGSGKSTLIKILSGYHAPDAGTVFVRGQQVRLPFRPGEAHRFGLAFLHQDLSLVESMTVLENLRVGHYETTRYGRLRWRRERERVRQLLREMNLDLAPDTPIRDVPQAERALIAFTRALQGIDQRGVLVLDEPTAYLPAPSVQRLFQAIREVARQGSAVLLVSHRLEEVMAISDRVSVLRDGQLVGTVRTTSVSEEQLVRMLLGRELGQLYPERVGHEGEMVLSVSGLSGSIAKDLTFSVRRGEIVGITGLVGMGHDEVPYLIFGARPASAGQVTIGDQTFTHMSPAALRRAGVALLPADRQRASGVPQASVLENVTLPTVRGTRKPSRESA